MKPDDAMNFITAMHAVSARESVRRIGWAAYRRLEDAAGYEDDRIEDRPVIEVEGKGWRPRVQDYIPTEEDKAACDWVLYQEPEPPWEDG